MRCLDGDGVADMPPRPRRSRSSALPTAPSWRSTSIRTSRRSPARTTRRTRWSPKLRARAKAAGLWAPHLPPEAGGTGRGFLAYAHLNEEIGRSVWAQLVFNCQAPDAGNGEILHLFGTEEQKERFLRAARRGRDAVVLRDDRARGVRRRPDRAADACGARRRRVGDRRAQVVLVAAPRAPASGSSWRSPTPTPSRTGAMSQILVPADTPGDRDRAGAGDRPPGPRLVDALRGDVHGRARPGREPARRAAATASGSRRSGSARGESTT